MPFSTEDLLQRIRAIMPDLEIEQFERDEEGLINDVVIVNQKWVPICQDRRICQDHADRDEDSRSDSPSSRPPRPNAGLSKFRLHGLSAAERADSVP